MKKYILLIFACIYAIHLNAQNAGINFLHGTTWAEAVAKAKAENKLIFIDFYTQWCGPCMNMAQTVFSLPTVGYYYNQTFINLKIDAEEGEGITLAKKYGVRSYPTYAFVDPATEEIVHRSSSRQTPEQFIQTGKDANIPTKRSFYLQEQYTKGNRERAFLIDYINYHYSVYARNNVQAAFDELIKGGAKLTDPNVWEVYEGKDFNLKMIRINNDIREQKYEAAATQIDAMIADTTVNQQELISRLKFIARLGYKAEELPEFWFNKCVGYLQYIAYNQTDRDDAFIHQEYAAALEMVLRKLNGKAPIPACLSTEPAYGKKVYNMRPDALKMKPKRKK